MGHYFLSNEELRGLDVQQEESELAKLYRHAKEDAVFLRSLSVKQESDFVSVPFRSSSVGHRQYALQRQKYLVMYSPFRTFGKKEENKSMKEKIRNKWFILKENTKIIELKSNKDKDKSSSCVRFLESVVKLLRFLRWANAEDVHQVGKSSIVSPIS